MNKHSKKDLLKQTAKLEKELAVKSYGLKIESALEKVSIAAMSMRKSKDLSGIGSLIFKELKKLGFVDLRNTEIIINSDAKETITSYYYSDYGVTGVIELDYKSNAIVKGWAAQLKKASNAFAEVVIPEKEMKAWRKYREEIGYLPDRKLNKTKTVYYYSYSTGPGALSISSFSPVTKEQIKILRRFRNVFQLSYRRYADIVLAERQAREAKVEAALERIRASSMAMHRSDGLDKVIREVTEQLILLGFDFDASNITTDPTSAGFYVWNASPAQPIPSGVYIPYKDIDIINWIYSSWAFHEGVTTKIFNKAQKNAFFKHYFTHTEARNISDERKKYILNAKSLHFSFACRKDFALGLVNYHGIIYTEEQNNIFARFAQVFDQSYTRFLDLQKAEAQAREAEIQLALERVRARTMAMYKSEEIQEIVEEVFKRLEELGVGLDTANILIFKDDADTVESWTASTRTTDYRTRFLVSLSSGPHFDLISNALSKGENLVTHLYDFDEKNKWFNHLFEYTDYRHIPEDRKQFILNCPLFSLSVGLSKNIGIQLNSYSRKAFTDEENNILIRFTKVFEQSYTRFLDLQKAEAQAREAQIELGLERVRAKAMAMQNSNELSELVAILFDELVKLDLVLDRCIIWIFDRETLSAKVWMANSEDKRTADSYYIKRLDHPYYKAVIKAWKEKNPKWVYDLSGKNKRSIDELLLNETELSRLPDAVKSGIRSSQHTVVSASFNNFGFIEASGPLSHTEEQLDILNRFGKVFDLSYTRFSDLQKAEAQAREAQIELALERVRARTMAMQKSDELAEAAQLLYHEFGTLGINTITCGYMFIDEEKNIQTAWTALPDGTLLPNFIDFPLTGDHVLNKRFEDWKQKKPLHIFEIQGEVNKEHHKFLSKYVPPFVVKDIFSKLPDKIVFHCANFSNGYLLILAKDYFSPDDQQTITRFAKVFEMTYRRFLDLQKAEAQVRESQIQLALERVRARTMAMHRSEELAETAQVMFHQLQELGGIPDRIAIGVVDELTGVVNFWSTDQVGSHINNSFKARLNERTVISKTYQAWKDHKKSLVIDLHGEELKEWIQFAREEMAIEVKDEFIKDRRVHNLAFFSHGWILVTTHEPQAAETIRILERFAAVFSLTYRRFLDLQRAEAQAREAQIEAALERVRARSMAMHHSSELHAAADVLFQQLRIFGANILNAGIALCTQDADEDEYWLSSDDGVRPVISIPHTEDAIQKKLYEDWKNKSEFYSVAKGGDELRAHYNYMSSVPKLKPFFEEGPDWSYPTWQKWHAAYFSYGYLFMITLEPYGEEKILVRFARVFEQAYTRFLDLQKAEAQAREAQVEAALEKVRSRSLAMHKSDELQEVVNTVFERLKELNVEMDSTNIAIFKEGTRDYDYWIASPFQKRSAVFHMPYIDPGISKDLMDARETHTDVFSRSYSFEEKNAWFERSFQKTDFKFLDEQRKKFILDAEGITVAIAFAKNTGVQINRYSSKSLAENEIDILKRFSKVFEQAYIRFLDLQKAEAQAKEAQIEAALERVRSRSMAMHQSNDLHEVIKVVTEQLSGLELKFNMANFARILPEGSWDMWLSTPEQAYPSLIHVPYIDHRIFNKLKEVIAQGVDFFSDVYEGEEKNIFIRHFFENTVARNTPEERKQYVLSCRGLARSVFLTKNIWLNFSNYDGIPYSDEENAIFKRFANAFEQSYTRFLDLQRAEAQTREAQIETALERVRSKAMAMHNSADLSSAASVVFTELKKLGIRTIRSGISLQNKENRENLLYTSTSTDIEENLSLVGWAILDDHPVLKEIYDSWMRGEDYFPILKGDELKSYYEKIRSTFTVPAAQSQDYEQHGYFIAFTQGMFYGWAEKPFDDSEKNILKRFASVVDLTFKRYFDLQKAEANVREAQIETSLERVRSRTMAMHNSNDVGETVATMFAEFVHLGIHTNRCGILIFNDQYTAEVWTARSTPGGNAKLIIGKLDLDAHKMLRSVYSAWKAKETFYQYDLLDDDLVQYYTAINNSKFYPTQFDLNALPSKEFHSDFFFADGSVFSFTNEPVAEEDAKIIKRFALVFGQTYRRYLDLQKAEAQAKEAQIELALERVRAKAMAMQRSDELNELTATVSTELGKLDIILDRCFILIYDTNTLGMTWWMSNPETSTGSIGLFVKYHEQPPYLAFIKAWRERIVKWQYILEGETKKTWDKFLFVETELSRLPDFVIANMRANERVYLSASFNNFGCLTLATLEPLPDEQFDIMLRFAKVFDLTYTRFNDLKQAEAQAREAQIEASLERVRSKTMAMHSSDDVTSAIATMFTELDRLGIENMRCGIAHYLEDHKMEVWSVSNLADGKVVRGAGLLDTNSIPFWKIFYSTWQQKEDFLYYLMAGKEKEDYFKKISTLQNYLSQSIENVPDLSIQAYYFSEGSVWAFSLKPHTEEDKQVMKRFASVFSLTFRRYQDLKKAEAQAREATIEAALEKVRGKAMAMHNSNDLSVTASMVFTELRKLGISPIRCGVGLLSKGSRKAQLYSATPSADGDSLSLIGWVILSEHPVLEKIYESWLDNEEYYPELQGEQMRSYYQLLLKGLPVAAPKIEDDKKQYGHFLPFSVGCLYAWSEIRYDDAEIKILKRFATIIDLTFRRYIELQTSEANAREAVKQAALDRVRAEIASMRTVADLDRITPLIWNELTILGLPFIRCGIFLMDDSQKLIHTFLSTPDGKAIGAFHLPYDTPGNFSVMLKHWLDKKIYISRWDEVDFIGIAEVLLQQGSIASKEQYLGSLPKGGFYLHFLPFLQGMLYVGNATQLGEEEIELIQHVADAFSTAYARYEDFNKLEAAKQQVEKTLTDLKQAQTQLVQSEKMASLGELTAGIAHEIQNPLNFVNNFSEVSNELLDEMKIELEKGNHEDALAIAKDVKENLEKINHHGKRADGIVKGMLQHSRTSSGQKEMTDINSLADEYLRLAYHGLRAKEKSFNAKFETVFDKNVGEVNIVPQDIGRVILNLINNAFYAVSERKKVEGVGYEPTVVISTASIQPPSIDRQRLADGAVGGRSVQIKVTDNGGGIPQKVLDKIFQPFFTTKPTGQGTGLGLSLAYDIIKAHGGDIKVETKEGEGSEFVIQLPVV